MRSPNVYSSCILLLLFLFILGAQIMTLKNENVRPSAKHSPYLTTVNRESADGLNLRVRRRVSL
jgi:hypothetical protein